MKIAILLIIGLCLVRGDLLLTKETPPVEYESEWAVHLHEGTDPYALEELGFEVLGQVGTLEDVFLVRHKETQTRHLGSKVNKFTPSLLVTETLATHSHVKWAEQQYLTKLHSRAIVDPLFVSQWHLSNTGQFGGAVGVDANIQGAWDQGFYGQGVRIAIVDDGFQTTHPDLAPRYQAASSFSYNTPVGNSPDPNVARGDFHGTSAAGVALAANNTVCGVGAAYMAEGAGIRLISEAVADATIATGITYRNQLNHIYSNSWGPGDDGVLTGGPSQTARAGLASGVATGRNGLGSIFLWAAGNGLQQNDNCNYDGWATSLQTMAIGAIGNDGKQAFYSEPCAAMLVTAPSSSANAQAGVRTSDIVGTAGYDTTSCTSSFGGTSSACPLVAGITALVLQANPSLTWRDVPVILARTAAIVDATDPDWKTNKAGFHVNHKYGFGKVDATAAVNAAKSHSLVAAQQVANSNTVPVNQPIPDYSTTGVTSTFSITSDFKVEKVLVTVTINHQTSGDLQIVLTSPSGTESVLSTPHAYVETIISANTARVVGPAPFGSKISFDKNVTGNLLRAAPVTGCGTITNCAALAGRIAIVNTGVCTSIEKAKNMQNCGAVALVIGNTDANNPTAILRLTGTDATVTIPTFSASLTDTNALANNQAANLKISQYAANNYQNGWQMATVRLLGEPASGTWSIKVVDGIPGNTGTFNSYSVSIYGSDSKGFFPYGGSPASALQICLMVPMLALFVSLLL